MLRKHWKFTFLNVSVAFSVGNRCAYGAYPVEADCLLEISFLESLREKIPLVLETIPQAMRTNFHAITCGFF